MALSSGARNQEVGNDVVGTGAAGCAGIGAAALADRLEGGAFEAARQKRVVEPLRVLAWKERGRGAGLRSAHGLWRVRAPGEGARQRTHNIDLLWLLALALLALRCQ